jgi:hypothetical protein
MNTGERAPGNMPLIYQFLISASCPLKIRSCCSHLSLRDGVVAGVGGVCAFLNTSSGIGGTSPHYTQETLNPWPLFHFRKTSMSDWALKCGT